MTQKRQQLKEKLMNIIRIDRKEICHDLNTHNIFKIIEANSLRNETIKLWAYKSKSLIV